MLSKETILDVLRQHKSYLFTELGVRSIGLFGSYAKDTVKDDSDVDILVEMPPNYNNLCTVFRTLENELNTKIDLVRVGPHLSTKFLQDIRKEIIYV